jgi:hypothetical protein
MGGFMRKIIVFCLMLASLALAQKIDSVAVLKSLTDRESKITPEQLNLLSQEVYGVASKELPRNKFYLMSLDDVEKKLGPQTYFENCSETECVKTFVDQLGINYGARCDIYSVDKQLFVTCDLYGTEKGNIAKIPPEPVKNIAEAQALIRKEVPAMFHQITKSPQEICSATPGKMWWEGACSSKEEICTNSGGIWDKKDEDCKSKDQISCELKKGFKWEGRVCKSPAQQNCDKKGLEWDFVNEKCKPAVAVHIPTPAPIPVPSGVAPGMGDGGSGYRAQIQTEPAGASLNLNGAPYCNSTPCPISVYERSVRLTATLNDYETADTTINITMPDQIVKIKLKQKVYPVDVATEPSGVSVALEGEADFFECQTPCVWYFKKGNVKVSVRDKFYESKDTAIFVAKETEVNLKLNPNYGVLNIDPAYSDDIGKNESWSLTIDGEPSPLGEIKFLPGNYNGKLSHNCYEDIKIDNVRIEKDGRVDFDMSDKLALKQSGLVLKAERYYSSFFSTFNKQVSVPFSVNGKVAGETAFNGSVPLCSEIEIDSKKIDAKLESGGSVEYTYKMRSYLPSIISGAVGTALLIYGLYQNSEIENVYMKEYVNKDIKTFVSVDQLKGEYDKAWDEVESTKSARNLAYVLSGISFALGVVLWF